MREKERRNKGERREEGRMKRLYKYAVLLTFALSVFGVG